MLQTQTLCIILVLAPLAGAILAGIFGRQIGRVGAHCATIAAVGVSFAIAIYFFREFGLSNHAAYEHLVYSWVISGHYQFGVGFFLDKLSVAMLLIVTFVSLLVHIYSVGYMAEDPCYQRFFSYICFFTFAMLMLVTANNFMQLFFGWEGVGLASYLLIGFWFKKDSAISGSLKAFLVNRVGDFGFLLGIACVLFVFKTLDYTTMFQHVNEVKNQTISLIPGHNWSVLTVICLTLFVGAMGKSAQVPLHVWLPESMEGPTPISALIHAATMVTAGVYMVSRMSPLYEHSQVALSVLLVIGATGALFLGILGVVQNDIKRVVAYSTLSQLGYMITALGASAFAAGMFHLLTHACFKALLFLGAGSVIIAMHHEQDMRKMGGLWRHMPITYITFLIGTLALCGIPPFSGFYSKDAIIEAVKITTIPGAHYAYFCVLTGVFVTALYSFRCFFLTFHGKPRMDEHTKAHLKESPWVVWLPLVLLAIPSVTLGFQWVGDMLFNSHGYFGKSIYVAPQYDVLAKLAGEFHGAWAMAQHAVMTLPFWLAIGGVFTAILGYIIAPNLPAKLVGSLGFINRILESKYGFDDFNDKVIVGGGRGLGQLFSCVGDNFLIDGLLVNGTGNVAQRLARGVKAMQTGVVFHYAFIMVFALGLCLAWFLF